MQAQGFKHDRGRNPYADVVLFHDLVTFEFAGTIDRQTPISNGYNARRQEKKAMIKLSLYQSIARKIICYLAAAMAGYIFYRLCARFPICSDDYSYSYNWVTKEKVKSFSDIWDTLCYHYMNWGGRMVAHGLAQIFLAIGKTWFNIANTICYLTTVFLICVIGRSYSIKPYVILAVTLWWILPVPGSSIFWLTGSCNYLWSAMFTTAWLVALLGKNTKIQISSLCVALFAGNSHEGISICILFAIIMYTTLNRRLLKNKIYICSVILYALGSATNILAPGNFVRLETNHTIALSILQKLSVGFQEIISVFYKFINASDDTVYCFFLIPIAIIANACVYASKKEVNTLSLSLICGSIIGIGLPLMSGFSYPRAYFGTSFVAVLSLSTIALPRVARLSKYPYLIIFYLVTLCSLSSATAARKTLTEFSNAEEEIGKKCAAGDKIIICPSLSYNFNPRYIETWGRHECHLKNRSMAKYYNGSNVAVFNHYYSANVFSNEADVLIAEILSKINEIELFGDFDCFCYAGKLVFRLPCSLNQIDIAQKSSTNENKKIPFASFVYNGKTYVVLNSIEGVVEVSYTMENGEHVSFERNVAER